MLGAVGDRLDRPFGVRLPVLCERAGSLFLCLDLLASHDFGGFLRRCGFRLDQLRMASRNWFSSWLVISSMPFLLLSGYLPLWAGVGLLEEPRQNPGGYWADGRPGGTLPGYRSGMLSGSTRAAWANHTGLTRKSQAPKTNFSDLHRFDPDDLCKISGLTRSTLGGMIGGTKGGALCLHRRKSGKRIPHGRQKT